MAYIKNIKIVIKNINISNLIFIIKYKHYDLVLYEKQILDLNFTLKYKFHEIFKIIIYLYKILIAIFSILIIYNLIK